MIIDEQEYFTSVLKRFANPDSKILDVACGYGRNLRVAQNLGYNIIGYDINENIVAKNKSAGLNSLTALEFKEKNQSENFDILVLSHIIEHMAPKDLMNFMGEHLGYLKPGGVFLVFTPLLTPYFFDDFDHVKVYQPNAFEHVFCQPDAQIKFSSPFQLKRLDIQYRKGPYQFQFVEHGARHLSLFNRVGKALFQFSRGRIGRIDGWAGVYKKV